MRGHQGMNALVDAIDSVPALRNHSNIAEDNSGWIDDGLLTNDFEARPNAVLQAFRRQTSNQVTGPGNHRCRICQRTYERADHLSRHVKSHENARPFQCQKCSKTFNRADVLNRHVLGHERNSLSDGRQAEIRRTDRAGRACVACAGAKARCEDQKPCRRCRLKSIACESQTRVFDTIDQVVGDDVSDTILDDEDGPGGRGAETRITSSGLHQADLSDTERMLSTNTSAANDVSYANITYDSNVARSQTLTNPPSNTDNLYNLDYLPVDTAQIDFDSSANDMLFPLGITDFNNQQLDFGLHDFNFQEENWQIILEQGNQTIPNKTGASGNQNSQSPTAARDVARGHAAFRRSPWLWTPAPDDHVLRDQDHLDLDERSLHSELTPLSAITDPTAFIHSVPVIDTGLRDKMFHLVSSAINKFATHVPNFPSLDILNHIVEAFFVRQSYQIDRWIHIPTISKTDAYPEFLIAVVTAGTTVISVPAIWKLGLVLQDVVRVIVGDLWERENLNTRKLQPIQAFILCLDTGLWSGFQRQMELGESFLQPMVTMMRRGGVFAAPLDTQALTPDPADDGAILEAKWRQWAKRESFKRLSIHVFLHDTRASIALQKNPLIAFTELTFSLPASRNLFLASSAAEWKLRYEEEQPRPKIPLPRLIDVLHNMTLLESLQKDSDVPLCYTAIIHGFWSQVWAFRESSRFHTTADGKDSVHSLWLLTQQRELCREIEALRGRLLIMEYQIPELIMTAELLLLILHVAPEDLQRFAGKAGEEAASLAQATLQTWSTTEQARKAVYHGGQIFRWASLILPADLRDFYTIVVYFAALAMWSYGHLAPAVLETATQQKEQSNSRIVFIDGSETRETLVFISSGVGVPALMPMTSRNARVVQSHNSAVRLDNPNEVLDRARGLYRDNFPVLDEALPPLVENIGNLMRDLRSLSESRFSRCPSPMGR